MTISGTTTSESLTDRLAALVASKAAGGPDVAAAAKDTAILDRIEDLADLTDGLRADLGTLHASGDQQTASLGRLEQRLTGIESRVEELGQAVRGEFARLEAALGQRVEEAALALAETLLARPVE